MYEPRTQPRDHQREALRRIAEKPTNPSSEDVFALLMDMGTGKTKVVLDEWGEREAAGDLSDILVVAPAGSYRNWFTDHPDDPSELTKHLSPDLRERMVHTAWVSGGGVNWKRQVDATLACRDRPRAMFMNIEAISTVQKARDACTEFLSSSRHGAIMAVDESTTIKTPSAQRTKHVLKISEHARVRRIMSGLVAPKSPMDLFSQFEFLDWRILGVRSFHSFRMRYAILQKVNMGGRTIFLEVGYRNTEELQRKIAPYSYRVLKEDCLDLDPKVYTSRDVELTPEQNRIYREIKEYATASLGEDDHVTATAVITQMLRLHQVVCGHVTDELGKVHELPEKRTTALLELLQEHQGKAIIWCTYDYSVRKVAAALAKAYGQESVACFWGGNARTRGQDEARFKSDPRCRWMVSTPAAGGRGNTWVVANLVVYYGNTWDLEMRNQSEDRAHRDGQTRRVTYVDLIARGTVDEKFIQALRRKINLSTLITGENYREWLI